MIALYAPISNGVEASTASVETPGPTVTEETQQYCIVRRVCLMYISLDAPGTTELQLNK